MNRNVLRAIIVAAACSAASAAFAQTSEVNAIGGYRLGMTRAEAEAANPGRWGELVAHPIGRPAESTPLGETVAPNMAFGGIIYSVRLVFRDDALRVINLEHGRRGRQGECAPHFRRVVSRIEAAFGPLTGVETAWDASGQQSQEHRTGRGSRYRAYEIDGRGWRARANSGAPYRLQVSALHIPPGASGVCIITISVRDDYGLGPDFTPEEPPSVETLQQAALFEGGQVTTLPGFERSHQLMPKFAEDNALYGSAELECLVRDDQSFWCRVKEETPEGVGFGLSALAMMQYVRAAPAAEGGAPPGSRVIRRVRFADQRTGE